MRTLASPSGEKLLARQAGHTPKLFTVYPVTKLPISVPAGLAYIARSEGRLRQWKTVVEHTARNSGHGAIDCDMDAADEEDKEGEYNLQHINTYLHVVLPFPGLSRWEGYAIDFSIYG